MQAGLCASARSTTRRLLEVAPSFTIGGFARMNLFRPTLMAGITGALGKAGLPA